MRIEAHILLIFLVICSTLAGIRTAVQRTFARLVSTAGMVGYTDEVRAPGHAA